MLIFSLKKKKKKLKYLLFNFLDGAQVAMFSVRYHGGGKKRREKITQFSVITLFYAEGATCMHDEWNRRIKKAAF